MRGLTAGKCLPLLSMTVRRSHRMTASVAVRRFMGTAESFQ
jgi:hypothetical protein